MQRTLLQLIESGTTGYVTRDAGKGVAFPDMQAPQFAPLRPLAMMLLGKRKLHIALRKAFGGRRFLYTGFSDMQLNRSVGWHRDLLNDIGRVRASAMADPFASSGEEFAVLRVILYLEDHDSEDDHGALELIPGSQNDRGCNDTRGVAGARAWHCRLFGFDKRPLPHMRAPVHLHPKAGDAIIFDQRIIHRGRFDARRPRQRASVQLSFGLDNHFTRSWAIGDNLRRESLVRSVRRRPRRLADDVADVTTDDGWSAACAVERRRATRYLGRAVTRMEQPQPPEAQARKLNATLLHRLKVLLHSRGTLCTTGAPCAVRRHEMWPESILKVCLPPSTQSRTFCEVAPNIAAAGNPFTLRKACASSPKTRCFPFDVNSIWKWAAEIRNKARIMRERSDIPSCKDCGANPAALRRRYGRCAVVMSGHTLRCGRPWAKLIDSKHYDAVWRSNSYPSGSDGRVAHAGTRTDFAWGNCDRAPLNSFCLQHPSAQLAGLRPRIRTGFGYQCKRSRSCHLLDKSGLGFGHSGGYVLDHAIAMCESVDVFGMGMYSAGGDTLYQHFYDASFASSCAYPCVNTPAAGNVSNVGAFLSNPNVSRVLCRPKTDCSTPANLRGPPGPWGYGVKLLSEEHDDVRSASRALDPQYTLLPLLLHCHCLPLLTQTLPDRDLALQFFLLSELRVAVLHALGLISWVWY